MKLRSFNRLAQFVIGVVSAAGVALAQEVFVPQPLLEQIDKLDATQLDIGKPELIFDLDPETLIRTPSINPAFVRGSFKQPVTFAHLRLQLIQTKHTWSLAVADSLADLEAERGSYRLLFKDQVTPDGRVDLALPAPVTFQAFELNVLRQGGDDYVHISELQFCTPGRVEAIEVERITARRSAIAANALSPVTGTITEPVETVVWFKGSAVANGVALNVGQDITWEPLTAGLEPFGEEPGMFVLTETGPQKLGVRYGDFEREIALEATPRKLANRRPDVEILFIERLPRIDYPGPDNQDPQAGWPAPGSTVTWRAHVFNWGTAPLPVTYEWRLDDEVVARGRETIPVGPPGVTGTPIDLEWEWTFDRHDLTLTVQPIPRIAELLTNNNTLTIQTNAITCGFWVERSLWDYMHEHQHRLPTKDANSFAGWGQRMMRQWNKMFRAARFAEYPDGIVERVRLDRVVVVPDFGLPLAGGLPSNNPDLRDKTVDMTWGMESGEIKPGTELPPDHWWSPERAIRAFENGDIENQRQDPPFWCGLGYIHELAHARYLVDAYGFNVHTGHGTDITQRMLHVTDEEGPILGRYLPLDVDLVHWRNYPGQMGGNYWAWSVFDAMCWNRRAGWRARGGNCNSPPVIGEFLNDIPETLVYQFEDTDGNALAGAEIWIYQAAGTGQGWYTKLYDDEPDLQLTADNRGRITVDRTLWAENGQIRHTFGQGNGKVLVRVTYEGQHYYLFEEVTHANIAYNLGHTDRHVFRRQVTLRTGDPSPDEWDVNRNWAPPETRFGRPAPAVGQR
jgi:hypothetical protein